MTKPSLEKLTITVMALAYLALVPPHSHHLTCHHPQHLMQLKSKVAFLWGWSSYLLFILSILLNC